MDYVEAIEKNLVEAWRHLVSIPGVDLYDGRDMMRFSSGVDYALCNGVFNARFGEGGIHDRIEGALEHFRSRSLPMLWWVGPSTLPAGLGGALEKHGLVLAQEAPGMAVELSALGDAEAPPGARIASVDSEDGLADWAGVFQRGYEIPDFVTEFFTGAIRLAGLGATCPFRHFVGYQDDTPTACSSTFSDGEVVGLYNVATLPECRGAGMGALVSLAPQLDARAGGCRLGILHATEMGLPVYRRLGFEEHCVIKAYLHQAAAED